MKKQKGKQPRRPAQQHGNNSKRVDPDMFAPNAADVPPRSSQQRRPPDGNPKVFDQAVQPIPRQQPKKQGMQQTILPMTSAPPPAPMANNNGQPRQKGKRRPQQPERQGIQQAVSPMASAALPETMSNNNNGQAPQKRKRKPQQPEKRLTRGEARRRRFKKKLLTFIILTLVIVAGITLSITFLFKIESFVIDGTSTYSQQDLEAAFGIEQGENIFSFNVKAAESKMSAALPYAETVTVRRRLPSTVVFKTTEAVESYYTENPDGGYVVLSGQLKVLRLSPEPPQDLPFLTGAEALLPKAGNMLESATEGKLDGIKLTLTAIANEGLVPISTLDVTNILEISFVYDKRAKVILGTANDLEDKLALAGVILRENIGLYEKGSLDVSNKAADKDRQGIWLPGNI